MSNLYGQFMFTFQAVILKQALSRSINKAEIESTPVLGKWDEYMDGWIITYDVGCRFECFLCNNATPRFGPLK